MQSPTTPVYFQTTSPVARTAPLAPQSSALPSSSSPSNNVNEHNTPSAQESRKPVQPPRKPLLRLELRDLSSEGTRAFLRLHHASSVLEHAVDAVLQSLYRAMPVQSIPPTRSITLILRPMPGVAYTTGLDIDNDHKEIHLSTDYIRHVPDTRRKEEIEGVIVHEMVHCWQHNASGTANGGLLEGIADWVRLKAGFAPPHWRRSGEGEWDAGYERTGYFLEWLEKEHGEDIVRKINGKLGQGPCSEDDFWQGLCGKKVGTLWQEYKKSLEGGASQESKQQEEGENKQSGTQIDTERGPGQTSKSPRESDASEPPTPTEQPSTPTDSKAATRSTDAEPSPDTCSAREKARRGGNMHIPLRPGAAS